MGKDMGWREGFAQEMGMGGVVNLSARGSGSNATLRCINFWIVRCFARWLGWSFVCFFAIAKPLEAVLLATTVCVNFSESTWNMLNSVRLILAAVAATVLSALIVLPGRQVERRTDRTQHMEADNGQSKRAQGTGPISPGRVNEIDEP